MTHLSAWFILFGLGAFHGINPAMGWLFAVALGLQQQQRSGVLRALPPLALGHALSVGIIVAAVLLARVNLSHATLRFSAAAVLFVFGCYRLVRWRHPAWVGMQVGFRDLVVWSFIMASAHGAGLMLVPLFINDSSGSYSIYAQRLHGDLGADPLCGASFSSFSTPALLTASVAVHTLGHFLVAAAVALLVYEKLGVAILRRAWFNLDLLWSAVLIATGACIALL